MIRNYREYQNSLQTLADVQKQNTIRARSAFLMFYGNQIDEQVEGFDSEVWRFIEY